MGMISNLEWPRILYKRATAIQLGFAAVLSAVFIVLSYGKFNLDSPPPIESALIGIVGALSVAGYIALLICMGFFWLKCDGSSKANRTVWFLFLLFGFAIGSHIAYYFFVYVPTVVKRLRNPVSEQVYEVPSRLEREDNRIGPFNRMLLTVWALIAVGMFIIFILPHVKLNLAGPLAIVFFLISIVVAIEAVAHLILSFYRAGTKRAANSESDRRF